MEAKFVSLVTVHCHAHHLASACYYTAADLYSMVYETAKTLSHAVWKCFAVSPLRSACLAMHQTTMKIKGW